MTESVFIHAKALGEAVAEEICAVVQERPDALICMAAGHSSLSAFEGLLRKKREGFDFSRVCFIAMDEWAGMNEGEPESCGGFLLKNLLKPMGITQDRYFLFDGKAADRAGECRRADRFILEHSGIAYMLLGIGMNGHLALNEPGCDLAGGTRWVELSETTMAVGQKYFSERAHLCGGVTLGLKDILAARDIVLAITGVHKRDAVRALRGYQEPSSEFPASALVGQPHARVYLDQDAASPI